MNVFDLCTDWDYQIPSADFSATPITGTVPLTVAFSDQSAGNISTYLWDFGDQTTSAEANPIHIYTSNGAFTVSLTVSGPEGSDSKTVVDYIQVHAPSKQALPWMLLLLPGD